MRVLMISKACVVGAYQRKLEEIAAHADIELTVVVPPEWRDERGTTKLERAYVRGYSLQVESIAFNGHFHLHFYPHLGRVLAHVKPDLVHIDEEPYDLVTWHAARRAQRQGAKILFFSWQNIFRRYPLPFSFFEADVLGWSSAGLVGNTDSEAIWRRKGYKRPLHVIPQFGVDPELFQPRPASGEARPFTMGYAGRLVREKGVDVLLHALARLPPSARVWIVGSGPEQKALHALATHLGVADRVRFDPPLPSTRMPDFFAELDVFVLPSRTKPSWKEQFGRVLIEAMACGVPVVGSNCGEIPQVIGAAGLVFPEDDVDTLTAHLRRLHTQPALRAQLAQAGRQRVLEQYTQQRIAAATVNVYRSLA